MEDTIVGQATAGSDVIDEPEVIEAERQTETATAPPLQETVAPHEQPFVGPPRKGAIAIIKKLVLFSDGTGNSSAKAQKTNVWRMFQALDLTTSDQLALYDDGVGTSTNKYVAAIGGAFGYGLKRNVIDLYKFVCRNHVDDTTEIYGFGFSRGAFTIRVLMGLITSEGLVNFTSEDELHDRAVEAYGHFRRKCFKPPVLSPVYVYRLIRHVLSTLTGRSARKEPYERRPRREVTHIKFLGLWDTVSAYGMPIAELKPAINWLFWPMNFSDLTPSTKIERACHALSLDDERTTFHPIVWDESEEKNQKRITQVWFAGVHANVGGGYPEDQLSLVSLDWMMRQAQDSGLRVQEGHVKQISDEKSSFGKIYDARAGFGSFYRYSPRDIELPSKKTNAGVLPIIHGSVIARMARGADAYVPNSLPPNFLVLAPDGQLLPMEGFPPQSTINYIQAASPATPQILATDIADERTRALKVAIGELNRPDPQSIDFIRNTVWWRRAAYLASSIVASLIALFPWLGHTIHAGLKAAAAPTETTAWAAAVPVLCGKIVAWDQEFRGIVKVATDAINSVVPPVLDSWIAALAKYPVEFAILALLFLLSLRSGELLRRSLRDYGLLAWHPRLREPFRATLMSTEQSTMRRTAYLLLAFDLTFLTLSMISFGQPDDAAKPLRLTAGLLNVLVLGRIAWHRRFIGILGQSNAAIFSGMATQTFAHKLRTSNFFNGLNHAIGHYCAPTIFGFTLLYLMLVSANKVVFDVEGASGAFCQGSIAAGDTSYVSRLTAATTEFSTDKFCWSSGLRLEKKTRYRVIVDDAKGDWFDRRTPTDPRGFAANSLVHAIATPLKRWAGEPWFTPIAHVGIKGNEEFALKPCVYRRRDALPSNPTEFFAYPDRLADDEANQLSGKYRTNEKRRVLVAEFTTQNEGEFFMFVNDAALAVPRYKDYFYKNNRGTAQVKIEEVHNDRESDYHYYCPK